MSPSPVLWIFFLFSGSIGALIIIAIHWQQCLRLAIRATNYTMDWYLDYKYRGYQCQIAAKPYQLIQIDTRLPDTSLTVETRHDDLSQPVTLHRDPDDPSGQCIKYVHYRYGMEEYIVPWGPTQSDLTLPIYSTSELETAFKMDYDLISTDGNMDPQLQLHSRILQFAGPKGNFYCDTPHRFPAGWLIDPHGRSILSEQDHLTMFSVTCQTYVFTPSQMLVVSDSIF